MYDRNGLPQRPRQIQKRGVLSGLVKALQTLREPWLLPVRLALLLMLLVLAGSLAACATTSAPSDFTPANPSVPPTTLSERSETFSSHAQRNISEWRKRLIELIPKP